MQETKEFRSSNIDFVAYLKTEGVIYDSIEKTNRNKIMFVFKNYLFEDLIFKQKLFLDSHIKINMGRYIEERKIITNIVREMLK